MENNQSLASYPSGAAPSTADTISDVASQAKNKAADLGRAAAEKIDQNRGAAADGIESAASTLHDKAASLPGGEKVSAIAHSAAHKLYDTADYVRANDVNSMLSDVERLVRKNPVPSLLSAAVLGFLLGCAFSSND